MDLVSLQDKKLFLCYVIYFLLFFSIWAYIFVNMLIINEVS